MHAGRGRLLSTRTSGSLLLDELLTACSLRWACKRISPAWYKNLEAWKALEGRPSLVDITWFPAESASLPLHGSVQIHHGPGGYLSANCACSWSINQVGQIVWPEEYDLDRAALRAAIAGQQDWLDGSFQVDDVVVLSLASSATWSPTPGIKSHHWLLAGVPVPDFLTCTGRLFLQQHSRQLDSDLPVCQFGESHGMVTTAMWTTIRCKTIQPSYADVWWKLLHGHLPLRYVACHFEPGPPCSSLCPLCRLEDQDACHFLISCSLAQAAWEEASRLLQRLHPDLALILTDPKIANAFSSLREMQLNQTFSDPILTMVRTVSYVLWIAYISAARSTIDHPFSLCSKP